MDSWYLNLPLLSLGVPFYFLGSLLDIHIRCGLQLDNEVCACTFLIATILARTHSLNGAPAK